MDQEKVTKVLPKTYVAFFSLGPKAITTYLKFIKEGR